MPDPFAIILRPFGLLILLIAAVALSRLLRRVIPDGPVKRFLYARHEVVPAPGTVSKRTQRIWTAIVLAVAAWIAFVQLTK